MLINDLPKKININTDSTLFQNDVLFKKLVELLRQHGECKKNFLAPAMEISYRQLENLIKNLTINTSIYENDDGRIIGMLGITDSVYDNRGVFIPEHRRVK